MGLVVVLIAVLASAEGSSAARLVLAGGSEHAASTGVHDVGWLATLEAWAIPLCGSVVAQEVLSRTLSSRSAAVARRAALAGGTAYLAVGAVPVALGVVGAGMMPGLEDPEQLVPLLARTHLSAVGYVVFAGALISAILSTVDSALLGAASYLSRNLVYARSSGASDARRLRTARAGVVVFGAVACGLAIRADGVFALVEEASGFGSAGVLVVMTFGLFTRAGGEPSGLAALLAGLVVRSAGAYVTDAIDLPVPGFARRGARRLRAHRRRGTGARVAPSSLSGAVEPVLIRGRRAVGQHRSLHAVQHRRPLRGPRRRAARAHRARVR